MKEQEKQIEEILKDIRKFIGYDTPYTQKKALADYLFEHYQPKLPENSVVLTGADYENYKEPIKRFANEVYKELYQLGKIYALPETLDADKYGIFSLTQEVVAKIAKEQFKVEIKE